MGNCPAERWSGSLPSPRSPGPPSSHPLPSSIIPALYTTTPAPHRPYPSPVVAGCQQTAWGMQHDSRSSTLSQAPMTTKQLQPSFACDASDTDGHRWETLTATEREFSRIDTCFSALPIHGSAPQAKFSFFDPPLCAIRLEPAEIGWNRSLLLNVSFPVSIPTFPPSQLTVPSPRRNPRFSTRPRMRFLCGGQI